MLNGLEFVSYLIEARKVNLLIKRLPPNDCTFLVSEIGLGRSNHHAFLSPRLRRRLQHAGRPCRSFALQFFFRFLLFSSLKTFWPAGEVFLLFFDLLSKHPSSSFLPRLFGRSAHILLLRAPSPHFSRRAPPRPHVGRHPPFLAIR